MSDGEIAMMLPGKARDIANRAGIPHVDVYAALVRLYDKGLARITVSYPRRGERVCGWEAM